MSKQNETCDNPQTGNSPLGAVMPRCSSCAYFEFVHWKTIEQSEGVCKNEKIYSNFHGKMVNGELKTTTPIDGISCNGYNTDKENRQYVKVGMNFGCVHHNEA